MTAKIRRSELSILNLFFCLLVLWIHCSSHPVSTLDHGSWQYGVMVCLQRVAFVSVPGFFFLSGLKLTLSITPPLEIIGCRGLGAFFSPTCLRSRSTTSILCATATSPSP